MEEYEGKKIESKKKKRDGNLEMKGLQEEWDEYREKELGVWKGERWNRNKVSNVENIKGYEIGIRL